MGKWDKQVPPGSTKDTVGEPEPPLRRPSTCTTLTGALVTPYNPYGCSGHLYTLSNPEFLDFSSLVAKRSL